MKRDIVRREAILMKRYSGSDGIVEAFIYFFSSLLYKVFKGDFNPDTETVVSQILRICTTASEGPTPEKRLERSAVPLFVVASHFCREISALPST